MVYHWTDLSEIEITNLYLYGTPTTPTNLTNDALIRAGDPPPITVHRDSFMATGPGRFALGSQSVLVETFFSAATNLSWMQVGHEYTKTEFINELANHGVTLPAFYGINIRQVDLADDAGDYWQRAYIWNSGSFELIDDAKFVVDINGNRSINDYAIVPNDGVQEDFNFIGGGDAADIANSYLKPQIDPWEIGRTVLIKFEEDVVPRRTYTLDDYAADILKYTSYLEQGSVEFLTLPASYPSVINKLWISGVTQTIYQDKPIIYGTNDADTLSASKLDDLPPLSPLRIYGQSSSLKGVALVAGGGNDTLNGGDNIDHLWGGEGNDSLTGGTGNDVLDGGENDDRYYYNIGDGNDIINDATGSNTLVINGQTIGALTRTSVESKTYKDVHDNTYALTDAGVLLITVLDDLDQHRSGTLTLNKFDKTSNNFGLVLNDPLDLAEPNSGSSIYVVGDGKIINPEGELDELNGSQRLRDQSYQFYVNTMSIHYDASLSTVHWNFSNDVHVGSSFQGGYQNDRLIGGQYRDWLDGKEGDDYIDAGAGTGLLGSNFVQGGLGSDYLLGGADTDFISGNTYGKWQIWDRANPILEEGYSDESAESKDYINGGGGNDRLSGDEGDDEVLGGTGDDDLLGGAGKDILAGGSGSDYILGDSRIELYFADSSYQAGKDWIYIKDNLIDYNDILDGGLDADYLLGELGDDLVLGGAGNDYM